MRRVERCLAPRRVGPPPGADAGRRGASPISVAHPADAGDLPVAVQQPVEHGDTVTVGDETLKVVAPCGGPTGRSDHVSARSNVR